jgi:hypothetical protein
VVREQALDLGYQIDLDPTRAIQIVEHSEAMRSVGVWRDHRSHPVSFQFSYSQ